MTKDELVDLVDAFGKIQKQCIPRPKINLYPDLHLQIVIGIVLNKNGSILVHKRSQLKKVNPGDIDHVCGGIVSGETPEQAFSRESMEETGIQPFNIKAVARGINKYNRYRYLLIGESEDEPKGFDSSEADWARFIRLDELKAKKDSGEYTFVDEFFEDTQLALKYK
jgi:mutator protein MutT